MTSREASNGQADGARSQSDIEQEFCFTGTTVPYSRSKSCCECVIEMQQALLALAEGDGSAKGMFSVSFFAEL